MKDKAIAAAVLAAAWIASPALGATRTFQFEGEQSGGVGGLSPHVIGSFTLDYDAPASTQASPGIFVRSDYLAVRDFQVSLGATTISFAGNGKATVLDAVPGFSDDVFTIDLLGGLVATNLPPTLIGPAGIILQLSGPPTAIGTAALPDRFDAFSDRRLELQFSVGAIYAARLVSLTEQVPTVPEPSSWAMMIGGFFVAGGAARRRPVEGRQAFA